MNRLKSEDFKEQLQRELKQIQKSIKLDEQLKQKAIKEQDQWLAEQKEADIQQAYRDYDVALTEYMQIYGALDY